jgi:DNA-binding transcriptional ArsR family regulator
MDLSYDHNTGHVTEKLVGPATLAVVDLSAPHTAVAPDVGGKVLMALAGTTKPLSGREVARLVGASQEGVRQALLRLTEHGLVHAQEAGAGAAYLYTLNRNHVAAEPVLELARLRATFFDRVKTAVEGWDPAPVHVSVFGSAARGDGDTRSDIDVLVVRHHDVSEDDLVWRDHVDRLASSILEWTGNRAGITEIGESDVRRLRQEQPDIVGSVRSDAVVISGPTPAQLFGNQ